jgi:hypothetical protein
MEEKTQRGVFSCLYFVHSMLFTERRDGSNVSHGPPRMATE